MITHESPQTIDKRMLARFVSRKKPWLNSKQAEIIVEILFETIAAGVMRDGVCEIQGFGRFFWKPKRVSAKPLRPLSFPRGQKASETMKQKLVDPAKVAGKGCPRQIRRAIYFRAHKDLARLINHEV